MRHAPEISIITPTFDAAASLPRMLDSVSRQKLSDWEHIIIIDGAYDDSLAIATAAAALDARIRVIEQANAGASAARNRGIDAARGTWLLFLDADDTIAPSHLKRLLARGARDVDVVCSGYIRRDAAGRKVGAYRVPPLHADPFRAIVEMPPTAIHAILVRRDAVRAVGGFDPALRTNEDWDLWLRIARNGARFVVDRAQTASYWTSEKSLTRDSGAMVRDVAIVLGRAGQRDPRVPTPLPAYVDGLPLGDVEQNLLSCALWSGAADIAGGGNGMAALDALRLPLGTPWQRDHLVGTMTEALMVGSGGSYATLAERWSEWQPRLEPFLARVATACTAPGLDFALLRDLEAEAARNAQLRKPRLIGRTLAMPATLRVMFRGVPQTGAEAFAMVPRLLPRRSFFMMTGQVPRDTRAATLRRYAARHLKRKFLRGLEKISIRTSAAGKAVDWAMAGLAVAARPLRRPTPSDAKEADVEPEAVGEPAAGEGSGQSWDAFFEQEDPWHYSSAYEQLKYEQTLSILPDRPIGRAIELACAEGMFTAMLAPRVATLRAVDISTRAIERAEVRCRGQGIENVDFGTLDFFNEPIGDGWDLIVSSEVLYYMADVAQLADFAGRVERALAPGGLFVHAHAYEVTDQPDHTGFDWGDPFGTQTISRVFGERQGLECVKAITTDLYRIELYRRVAPSAPRRDEPDLIELPIASTLERSVASAVVWNGAVRTRQQVEQEERAFRIPVLMYHRIADHGPEGLKDWRTTPRDFEHQLRFLRRRGYRSISIEEWEAGRTNSASLRGRPILLTFDDGYADFHDTAWPILARNGFSALVFVVTTKVGGVADWDAAYGDPAPLMNWDRIVTLHRDGVAFGSHLATHRAADRLPLAELTVEMEQSKQALEERLGVDVVSVAPPFGATNNRVEDACAAAGYRHVFEAEGDVARIWGNRWRIPRINIGGYESIHDFARLIGRDDEPPQPEDLP
nr:trifunctional glycosyltransferase/class I SAM-dependent methyltransferase/polysaccharide deacetylase [Hephaestia mangrovi]